MKIGFHQLGLIAALALGTLVGACGPSQPPVDTTADKTAAGTTTAEPAGTGAPEAAPTTTSAPVAAGTPGAGDSGQPSAAPAAGAQAAGQPAKSIPLAESKMIEELKKLGINTAKIPELSKLPLNQKKKVMPLLQKSLGYAACTGCHVEGDFKTETRNMKISRQMWSAYSVELRDEKGGPVFCDTCHSGQVKVLARADKEAVKKFMEDEYEHKLTRADKKDLECATCHGDSMELKIIEKLWKIPLETKK